MKLYFLKTFHEKFGVRLFVIVSLFLLIISTSFTAFFIYQQSSSLKNTLVEDSKLLMGILAYSVRLGVFSENKDLLNDTVEGIFQLEGVKKVVVFSPDRELLRREKKTSGMNLPDTNGDGGEKRREIFESLQREEPLHTTEQKDSLEMWSPVVSGEKYESEDYLMLDQRPLKSKNKVIGFVGVTFDKTGLNRRINTLLLKGILIAVAFLFVGSGITYFVARRITNPLKKLTVGVNALTTGGAVAHIPVETEDEVGNLARAFNVMTETLKQREVEKEQLEEQLRQAQKMEAIGTLAGGIAHDFNNILTAIIGFGNLLQMKLDKSNPSRVHVDQILSSAERAATLTQSLLAFSRKQLILPKSLNLNENINNIKKLLMRLIREDIEFKVRLSNEYLPVMADPGQIDQVLINLVTNARDAMPEGGVLTISTKSVQVTRESSKGDGNGRPGRYALLSVTDTGIGMDEKTMKRIFDPFFTTKEVGQGTGLGLSMVYGIIKQHDGFIDVSSAPKRGTSFKIHLPLMEGVTEEERLKPLPPPKRGTETLLIAEDDMNVRMLSKEILELNGYRVIEAIDGEDAVRKYIQNKGDVQLLLLDVVMPKKNGKEVYNEIVKIEPQIKALFISGYTSDIIQKKGILEEGLNFIYKPVPMNVLLQKVREVLDGKNASSPSTGSQKDS